MTILILLKFTFILLFFSFTLIFIFFDYFIFKLISFIGYIYIIIILLLIKYKIFNIDLLFLQYFLLILNFSLTTILFGIIIMIRPLSYNIRFIKVGFSFKMKYNNLLLLLLGVFFSFFFESYNLFQDSINSYIYNPGFIDSFIYLNNLGISLFMLLINIIKVLSILFILLLIIYLIFYLF